MEQKTPLIKEWYLCDLNSKRLSLISTTMALLLLISSAKAKSLSMYVSGWTYNNDCSLAKHPVTYCQGYEIGYNIGWANAITFI